MSATSPSTSSEIDLSSVDPFAEWQRGAAQFAFLRLERNLQCCMDAMKVRSPTDFQKVQLDWVSQFSSDYQSELQRQIRLLAIPPASAADVQNTTALVA